MKNNDLHKLLDDFNLSEIEMPAHQERLRQALLLRGQNQQTYHTTLRTTCKNLIGELMSHKKTLIGSGATLAIVAVMGLSVIGYQNTPRAHAESLANQSIKTMQSVSPEERAKFKQDFGVDSIGSLEEAKKAKDLKILTHAEYEAEAKLQGIESVFTSGGPLTDTPISGTPIKPTNNPTVTEGHGIQGSTDGTTRTLDKAPASGTMVRATASKYLRYTNPSGNVVLLALDANNALVFVSGTVAAH